MLRASTEVFYAYIAFETVSIASKESKKPTQYIPYATIISLVISGLMYIGISTVMVGLVHYSKLNTDIPMYAAVSVFRSSSEMMSRKKLPVLILIGMQQHMTYGLTLSWISELSPV